MKIPRAFSLAVDVAYSRGARDIKSLPRCYEMRVGDWEIAINGHDRESLGMNVLVPPFCVLASDTRYVRVVIVHAFGGEAGGSADAEDALIAALEAEAGE